MHAVATGWRAHNPAVGSAPGGCKMVAAEVHSLLDAGGVPIGWSGREATLGSTEVEGRVATVDTGGSRGCPRNGDVRRPRTAATGNGVDSPRQTADVECPRRRASSRSYRSSTGL